MRRLRSCVWAVSMVALVGCAAETTEAEQAALGTEQGGLEAPPTAAELTLREASTEECGEDCQVREWIAQERYEEAREVLTVALEDAPHDVEKTLMLVATNLRDELYDNAYELTSNLLEVVEDVRLLEKRAMASLLAHDVETAAHDFSETIQMLQGMSSETRRSICDAVSGRCASPIQREAYAWLGLATAEYNRRNLDRAVEIVDDLMTAREFHGTFEPAIGQFVKALVAAKRGDDATAKSLYEGILKRFPNEPGTLVNLGGIAYRAGDLAAARDLQVQAYENAGRFRRTAAIAWSNVGEIDMLQGDYEAALDKVQEAVEVSRNFAGGYFQLAVVHDVMGNDEASAAAMKTALELDVQGVSRWNTAMFDADWEAQFAALIAESQGNTAEASKQWHALLSSDHRVLAVTAKRHLASLADRAGHGCPAGR